MNPRFKKILLLLLAAALLTGSAVVQKSMNLDRDTLGLTRVQPLENAPPVLAFTTVALGGFRGLISNALWMRATDLQDDDKFFEMAQLADWITKLEPNFVQVWLVQAWNMAYNISVKFNDFPDRWRWVQRGIALLRDDGLRYNPNETLIYRELAWFFQHKLGANLDDASLYYKQQWANDMAQVFGKKTPNLDELINPKTADELQRLDLLTNQYKMDPKIMKEVDQRYGPLEWRLPEAHAIYWAAEGLKKAAENPSKIKPEDLITLRRVIYQSMQLSFQRGRLVTNPFIRSFEFGPNLDIIPKADAAYEQAMQEDERNRDHIGIAHRNFLRDAVYFLYVHNRLSEAAHWFQQLGTRYPDKPILDSQPGSLPRTMTLRDYCVARVQEDIGELDRNRVESAIEGLLAHAFQRLAEGEEDEYAGYKLLARETWNTYQSKVPKARSEAIGLRPFEDIEKEVLNRLLDPEHGLVFEMRAALRSRLGMEAEAAAPATPPASPAPSNAPEPPATNAPPEKSTAG